MQQYQQVLQFWFDPSPTQTPQPAREIWFQKDPEFDAAMRDNFLPLYEAVARGEYDHWKNEPESCLALIIVLDQFPRNLFRQKPKAFATDEKALNVAKFALKQQYDQQVDPVQRWFFYLPLEHSEKLEDQEMSLKLFSRLKGTAHAEQAIAYAQEHFNIIEQFGRFPHRNAILGRSNTPQEHQFLQQHSGF